MSLNHVALLVPSVKKAAAVLEKHHFAIGSAQEWEGEGTLEIYVGELNSKSALLLLMEPVKEGAYTRAMKKRGPGLHHLAIDVLNLESYIDGLSGSGWLLHPKSLHTIKHSQTAYLARPGTPMLIEVQQREEISSEPSFVQKLEMPLTALDSKMLMALGLHQVVPSQSVDSWIQIEGVRINLKDLY
ncbi:hypothetical protein [Bdellovibrio sp. HCB337]|uniref:hypothetical protein n=1 Tax=Bdellovibrio sp. HCB337 TaxID=3394358 RepID=UPI0039A646C5